MKLPSKIPICGKMFKVIQKPKEGGGAFSEGKLSIEIGTKYKEDIPEVLAHEVIEAILAIRDNRYALQHNVSENGDYLFSFSHKEYENLIKDIVFAFKGLKF